VECQQVVDQSYSVLVFVGAVKATAAAAAAGVDKKEGQETAVEA
jgi:hypothetical protein